MAAEEDALDQAEYIARRNIEHFRRRLAEETDRDKGQVLAALLAEEEAKLATFMDREQEIEQLLATISQLASGLFDLDQAEENRRGKEAALADAMQRTSFGLGLMDGDGKWLVTNHPMRRFVSETIPSRDPPTRVRWQTIDAAARPVSPLYWPGNRALRGETVCPGIDFVFTAEDGTTIMTRVAAMPVRHARRGVVGAVGLVEETQPGAAAQSGMPSSKSG